MRNLRVLAAAVVSTAALATLAPAAPASAATATFAPKASISAPTYTATATKVRAVLNNKLSRKAFTFEVMKGNKATFYTVPAGSVIRPVVSVRSKTNVTINGQYDSHFDRATVLPPHSATARQIDVEVATVRVTNRTAVARQYVVETNTLSGGAQMHYLTVPAGTTRGLEIGGSPAEDTKVRVSTARFGTVMTKTVVFNPNC